MSDTYQPDEFAGLPVEQQGFAGLPTSQHPTSAPLPARVPSATRRLVQMMSGEWAAVVSETDYEALAQQLQQAQADRDYWKLKYHEK